MGYFLINIEFSTYFFPKPFRVIYNKVDTQYCETDAIVNDDAL